MNNAEQQERKSSELSEKTKILVVGQTPPPYHGQAIMIGEMLKGNFKKVKLLHVRLRFSKETREIGRFQVRKIFHLIAVVFKILYYKIKHNPEILYYPPADPRLLAVMRDVFILSITRRFFKKTIFHFHASGISSIYDTLPWMWRRAFRIAFFFPDAAIRLSEYNHEDGKFLQAKKEFIIPNGIADRAKSFHPVRGPSPVCRLLYVGRLIESKGIKTLLEACSTLLTKAVSFSLSIVGLFESQRFEKEIMNMVESLGLEGSIEFCGFLRDERKFHRYAKTDIFCYPTFSEFESFGIVLLEAMQFSLPVVASKWQGVRSVVREGESGFLFPARDTLALADRLLMLIEDPELRARMGKKAREIYLREYTLERFYIKMENAFLSWSEEHAGSSIDGV